MTTDPRALTNDELRAKHTCIMAASSMHCLACARGVPYLALTLDEIEDALGLGRKESKDSERALLSRPGRHR